MRGLLLLLGIILLAGCYPPNTALDYLVHPLKDCNHDVRLDNRGSTALSLVVRVSDRISDTRCETSSAEGEALILPGQSQVVHAHIRCVDCYVNKSAAVNGVNGEKVHTESEGQPVIDCDDSGCR